MALGALLTEARDLLCGERNDQYGDPRPNYQLAAELATILTGVNLCETDIYRTMIAVKLARHVGHPKRDNLVDAAAYLDMLANVEDA